MNNENLRLIRNRARFLMINNRYDEALSILLPMVEMYNPDETYRNSFDLMRDDYKNETQITWGNNGEAIDGKILTAIRDDESHCGDYSHRNAIKIYEKRNIKIKQITDTPILYKNEAEARRIVNNLIDTTKKSLMFSIIGARCDSTIKLYFMSKAQWEISAITNELTESKLSGFATDIFVKCNINDDIISSSPLMMASMNITRLVIELYAILIDKLKENKL